MSFTIAIEFVVLGTLFVMSVDLVGRIQSRLNAANGLMPTQPKMKQPSVCSGATDNTAPDAPPVSGAKPVQIQFDSDLVQFESRPKFRSVGAAAIDYSKLSVRELRTICKEDSRFKGYSPYVKKGKSALVEFMNSK